MNGGCEILKKNNSLANTVSKIRNISSSNFLVITSRDTQTFTYQITPMY